MRGEEEVKWFSEQMLAKLERDAHKGGWEDETYFGLLSGVTREVFELTEELTTSLFEEYDYEAIIKECADVANFAMMIADKARLRHERE